MGILNLEVETGSLFEVLSRREDKNPFVSSKAILTEITRIKIQAESEGYKVEFSSETCCGIPRRLTISHPDKERGELDIFSKYS